MIIRGVIQHPKIGTFGYVLDGPNNRELWIAVGQGRMRLASIMRMRTGWWGELSPHLGRGARPHVCTIFHETEESCVAALVEMWRKNVAAMEAGGGSA